MEKEEQKIIDAIVEDIHQQSNLVVQVLDKEMMNARKEQLNFFKEGLQKETELFLEKELSELRSYAATKASQEKFSAKRKLLGLRSELIQQLLDEVIQNVKNFVNTEQYIEYMRKNLHNIPLSENGYFVVNEKDKEKFENLLSEINVSNVVKTGYIEIGGFYYIDEVKHIEFNYGFAERIEEVIEWFRSHSGFTVAESGDEHE